MITPQQCKDIAIANGIVPVSEPMRLGFNVGIEGLTPPTPNNIPPAIGNLSKIWYIGYLYFYQSVDALANFAFDMRVINYNKANVSVQFSANARDINTHNLFIITDQIVLNPIDPNESAILSFDGYIVLT